MKKILLTTVVLLFPILAIAQDNNEYECFIWHESQNVQEYCKEVSGRMFIQKKSNVSKDYVVSLVNELTDSQFELSWCPKDGYQDNYCRVITDDTLIDSIIGELLNDEGILMARRIFVKKDYYDKYITSLRQSGVSPEDYFKEPNMKNNEIWFLNNMLCYTYDHNPDGVPMDSICNVLGVTYELSVKRFRVKIPKNGDIFESSHRIWETRFFTRVDVDFLTPYVGMTFDEKSEGCWKKISDHFFLYNSDGSKKIYYELPNRLFVQKSDDVTQEYINTLLDGVIDTDYEKEWSRDYICRIVADEAFSDSIIKEITKDGGVLSARRIYVTKENYERYKYYPNMERGEEWFYNKIKCRFEGEPNQSRIDSLSNALGLTIQEINESYYLFETTKDADIFYVSQALFESGCFTEVAPEYGVSPKANSWSGETVVYPTLKREITLEQTHYGLDGSIIDASDPGVHIIKKPDGTVNKYFVR